MGGAGWVCPPFPAGVRAGGTDSPLARSFQFRLLSLISLILSIMPSNSARISTCRSGDTATASFRSATALLSKAISSFLCSPFTICLGSKSIGPDSHETISRYARQRISAQGRTGCRAQSSARFYCAVEARLAGAACLLSRNGRKRQHDGASLRSLSYQRGKNLVISARFQQNEHSPCPR